MTATIIDFPADDHARRSPAHAQPTDRQDRDAILEALDTTLVVEAAAGTGKTTELVNRVLRVLTTGRAEIGAIVAVTFTEKAAGELKLRLREALELARLKAGGDERARLDAAIEHLEEANVNTIHGFCAELLRERPVEASVDPLFRVLTEPEADRLYAQAFRAWIQRALEQPSDALRRALRRTSAPSFGGVEDDGPLDRLRSAGRMLAEWRDYPEPWHRPSFDRERTVDRLVDALHRLSDLTAAASYARDNLFLDTDAVRRLSRQIRLEQSFGERDLDGWESRLIDLARDRAFLRARKGSGHKYGKDVSRTEVIAARESLLADLQQFRKDADADLAAGLQSELAAATERYQRVKAESGALDFADLLVRARNLIRDDGDVRRHLQAKYRRIFVDEFQDTDPVQAEILLLLADRTPGKLFIVGDPKQAIYRFRGTDVGTYWDVSRDLEAQGGRVLYLRTSYRSVPEIQNFVNAAFAPEMQRDERTLQAEYVPLSPYRSDEPAQPSIVALAVPRPYPRRGMLRLSAKAIEESLPDAVGAFVAWLTDPANGWTVLDRRPNGTEERVPIEARHIAMLFRRFVSFGQDVTRGYVDALEARGVPHLLVGGKSFHDREEVETMRAALAAIEWPDDELSVFATLKGSLFAIDDEPLLEFRQRFGAFHPFRIPRELGGNSGEELALSGDPTGHLVPIAVALRLLQALHRQRNYRPVADTIARLLDETRAHVGFILRPAGEQALANVLHVAELARQYEASGGISFRGFIDTLRDAAKGEAAEAPILEEGSDGVRLLTVHKAKGLEFPVVILADPTCRMNRADASRYLDTSRRLCAMKIGGWAPFELHAHQQDEVDRDAAEGVRLAYVAATRARDLLVVPAVGDEPWEGGWFAPLNRALYPPMDRRRNPARGPKCPAFKSKDSILERPNDETAGPATVAPGLFTFADGYRVVWWDPGALDLGAKPPFGVRREELIVKDVPKHVVADGRTRYDRWCLARADARAAGATPSVVIETVKELAAETPGGNVRVEDLFEGSAAARRGGALFGTLVHAILAHVPLDASRDQIDAFAAIHATIVGARPEDSALAAATVAGALAHPLLVRAREADRRGACRRETPVTFVRDGTLVEGVADLAFEEEARWIVIDFKTDRELSAQLEIYSRQVQLYADAISAATGLPAEPLLLRV